MKKIKKKSTTKLPLFVSKISAGFPSAADEFVDDMLDLNELLITNKPSTYLLRVSGDSMKGAGILDKDIIIVNASLTPRDGHIVVASVNNEFLVKRWRKQGKKIFLEAANPDFKPLELKPSDEAGVFGIVTGLVRQIYVRPS